MARKTSADIFRQNISTALKRESEFYLGMFGSGDFLPVVKIDRGNCESFVPPMVEYERVPLLQNCYWDQTQEDSYEGDFSYKLTKRSGIGNSAFVLLTESETGLHGLIPGNQYRFSCYVRVANAYVGSVSIAISDNMGQSEVTPVSGFVGEWQLVTVTHTISDEATSATLCLLVSSDVPSSVEILFDNFELVLESEVLSSHFRGGSIYNEIELARLYGRYYTEALGVIRAQGDQLTQASNRYLHLQRGLVQDETDEDYINRFKSLAVGKLNPRRVTRWAILDALSYFVEPVRIEIVERFDIENNKFRVKFITFQSELQTVSSDTVAIADQSYIDNSYLIGVSPSTGREINPNINDILQRVKASGVLVDSFDVDRLRLTIKSGIAYSLDDGANRIPISRAGADQMGIVAGSTVNLDGSASSDPDGTISTYDWTQTAGTSVVLTGASTATPSFTAPIADNSQTLTFQLTVTDNDGATDTDMVDIAVLANQPPVARAGADQSNIVAGATVNLDGSTSSDPDGIISSYSWSQTSGDTVVITGATTATPSFTAPTTSADQRLTFRLTVTDNGGRTATDDIHIDVLAEVVTPLNQAPIARAGTDQIGIVAGATVNLDGSASSDPDGSISSYSWTQTAGDNVSLTGASTATPSFTAPSTDSAQTLTFRLTVTDNDGATDNNTVDVEVLAYVNQNPVARAGSNQTGIAAGATVNLDGSTSSDVDGTVESYAWTQTAGDTVSITGASTATPSFVAPSTGSVQTLTFQLLVTDDDGATDTDTIDVGVLAEVVTNQPPVARAGADQTVDGGIVVVLSGTASSDPDGSIVDYDWDQLSGTNVSISGSGNVQAGFFSPAQTVDDQVLVFRLTVTDNDGATGTDEVSVTVEGTGAGAHEQTVTIPASTNDVDSSSQKRWEKINIDIDDEFAPAGETRFIFRLIVFNNLGPDNCQIRFLFNESGSGQDLAAAWETGGMSMTFAQGSDSVTIPGPDHSSNAVTDAGETYVWSPPSSQADDVVTFFFTTMDISQDFQITLRV